LRDAALLLFATRGYEATTTEEIADAAGVSPRTVFRYFPTKDSILYFREDEWVIGFIENFLGQPAAFGEVEAMCAAFVASVPRDARGRRAQSRYRQAVESSLTLRGLEYDHQQMAIGMIADAVAQRRHQETRDEGCDLLAAVATLTYRRAVQRWLDGPARADVRTLITHEFALLAELFGGPVAATSRRRSAAPRP
jgi:AcrR family transcriptional regulator